MGRETLIQRSKWMSGGKQVPKNLKNGKLKRTVLLTEVSQPAMIPPFEDK
jgi:hypothetical protein